PLLVIALEDRQTRISEKAMKQIITFKDPTTKSIIREQLGDNFDNELIEILIEIESDDIDENINKGLRSLNPSERAVAIELYGKYKGENGREKLTEFLEAEEPIVRTKAQIALARLGDESAIKAIGDMLESDDFFAKASAVAVIEELDLKDYQDKLLEIAQNDVGAVGREAHRILYEWGNSDAREMLKEKITDSESFELYDFMSMVESSKDPEMIDTLKVMMSAQSSAERYAAARLIVLIDKENNQDTLDYLLSGMKSDVPQVREKVVQSLGNLPDVPDAKLALENIGLNDENPGIVHASIQALGKVGDLKSLNKIEPFLEDKDFQIRAVAAVAVLNIVSRETPSN
ncbi:HEAT repeat domain-containing protein, partial [bacterium]|nr:HEAT repeat domain-containing protein [bacterium]MBU1024584.1 HEAT repeat domain-containing protein [bacterium]